MANLVREEIRSALVGIVPKEAPRPEAIYSLLTALGWAGNTNNGNKRFGSIYIMWWRYFVSRRIFKSLITNLLLLFTVFTSVNMNTLLLLRSL